MCYFKSMILLKDSVFIGNTDSHSDMLDKLGLRDEQPYGTPPDFVKIEIIPPHDDFSVPVDRWRYKVDQDFLPAWYVEEVDRPRCFEALKTWAASHIFVGQSLGEIGETKDGKIYLSNCTVSRVSGGFIAEARNCTIDKMAGGTIGEMTGSTVDKMYGGTIRNLHEGSVTYMSGGGIHNVREGVIHRMRDGTVYLLFDGIIYNMAGGTVTDNRGTVSLMYGGTIKKIDNGIVREMKGGTVDCMYDGFIGKMHGGTICHLYDGIIGRAFAGTIEGMTGGTVNRAFPNTILQRFFDGLCVTEEGTILVPEGQGSRHQIEEAPTEFQTKFKVGDMITGTAKSDRRYSITNSRMIRGRVVSAGTVFEPHLIEVEIVEHIDRYEVGNRFHVDDSCFILVDSPSPAEETK